MSELADIMAGMQDALQGIFAPPTVDGTVTYTPADGSGPFIGVKVTVGKTEFEMSDGNGAVIAYQSRDYIFAAAALIKADGSIYEPQRGDSITEVQGENTFVYRLMLPDAAAQVWKWSDSTRQIRRVHTKQDSEA